MVREQEVQSCIMDFLKARGILFWRVNLGGVRRSGIGMTKNPLTGFPDIAGCLLGGRLFTVEVKKPGSAGNLSPEQIKWRDKLTAAGALHVVATSVEDVRRSLGI